MLRSACTPVSLLVRSTPPQSTHHVLHFECHLLCIDFMPAADTLHLGDATLTSHSPLLQNGHMAAYVTFAAAMLFTIQALDRCRRRARRAACAASAAPAASAVCAVLISSLSTP